jgi:hypothetical protein
MAVEKKLDYAGDVYFVDRDTGAAYGNVVGGLGWPGSKPGFLVVAGIALAEDLDLEAYPITVIFEAGDTDSEKLFRLALKFIDEYSCDEFYTDTKDANMMRILDIFNQDRNRRGLKSLYLWQVPRVEDPNPLLFYLQLIKKYTRPGRKSLHFGPESIYPGYLLNLSAEEAGKAKPADHPCVVALGYALAVVTEQRNRKFSEPTHYRTDFDPFVPNYGIPREGWDPMGGEPSLKNWDPFKH